MSSSLGEAFINVHADTHGMEREIREGTRRAGDEVESEDDFDGLVAAADKAGSRAGKKLGDSLVRDANGRLRHADGKFAKELEGVTGNAADKAAKTFGDRFSFGLGKRISGFGKLLAPKWLQTIATWVLLIGPAVLEFTKQFAPALGVLGAVVPLALGAAASIGVLTASFQGVGTAIKDAGKDQAAYAKDLKNLSPAARAFVKEIVAAKPALKAMRMEIQDRFFTGFSGAITMLSTKLIPGLEDSLSQLAFQLGDMGKKLVSTLSSPKSIGNLDEIIIGFSDAVAAATPGWQSFIDAVIVSAKDATPLLNTLAKAFSGEMAKFDAFINRLDKSGKLADFFSNAFTRLKSFAPAFHDIVDILKDIFSSIPDGGNTLVTVLNATASFFDRLKASGTLTVLFQAYNQFFVTMTQVLKPLLPLLDQFLNTFGVTLIGVLQQLGPPLAVLAQALAQALVPIIPILGQLLTELAPSIGVIAEAIAQLVVAIAPSLPPLISALAPVLVVLANTLAQLFTVAGNTLAKALPPLLDLLTKALKELLPFVQAAAPLLGTLAEVLGVLGSTAIRVPLEELSKILDLLSPVIQVMTGALTELNILLGDDSVGTQQKLNATAGSLLGLDTAGNVASGTISAFGTIMANTAPKVDKFGNTVCGTMTYIGGPKGCVPMVTKAFNALGTGAAAAAASAGLSLEDFRRRSTTTINDIKKLFASLAGAKFTPLPVPVRSPGGLPLVAHARGTITHGPEAALIGERGTEVVLPTNDPRRAAQLLHDSGLAARLGGAAPVVNVTVLVGNEQLDAHIDTRIDYADDRAASDILAGTRS